MLKARRTLAVLAVMPVVALALSACSAAPSADSPDQGPSSTGELTTLNVATIGLTSDGSLLTGIEQGFFEEEGLEISTSIVANPPAGLAAVQGGQVDIAYSPSIPLLNALSQRVPIQVIGAADGFPPAGTEISDPASFDDTGLFASAGSGVTKVADLAGKTIAIPARKAQLEVVIAGELEKAGVDPATGVNWVVLDFTSAVAALKNGTVDAAGLVSPFTAEAVDIGATQLSAPSIGFFESGATGLWTAGTATITAKPEAIAGFQRAIVKSNEYATAHEDEAIQAGLDYTKSTLTIDEVKRPVWPIEVLPEDLGRPNTQMVELGFLKTPVDLDGVILGE
ncbi:ABC transporter substrate-binding protein [Leucobacter luti]|uniref:NitT/TauT family transport system substrate-binding protein n=1 Tax=Leucobacter luti TaxID=340320 RepID=A0A4R6RWS8_9MICO|nr:ABC transporter substrate-binding protein [Leucobacter luti]QYM75782.1 ABC transporter substrate-binding protein [Leucobacter luti]TDP91512.1 NitT/TauT family transport system substrate-binding protein [Leucobacter luti]